MYQYNIVFVNKITKTSKEERDVLVRWWAKQPEQIKIEGIKLMFDLLKQQIENEKTPISVELIYSAFIQALYNMHRIETGKIMKRKKDGELNEEELKKIQQIRIARVLAGRQQGNKSKKRNILKIRYGKLMMNLREEGLSYREIGNYLKKYHRFKVCHALIGKVLQELYGSKEVESEENTIE